MGNEGQSRIGHTLPHLRTTPQKSCKLPVQGQQGRRVGRACAPSLGQQLLPARCQSLHPEAFPSALGRRQCHTCAPRPDQQLPTASIGALPPTGLSFQSICHSNVVITINRGILIFSFQQKLLLQCLKSLRSPSSDSSQDCKSQKASEQHEKS